MFRLSRRSADARGRATRLAGRDTGSVAAEPDRRRFALSAVSVTKHFGGVAAVTDVDLDVLPGTCHAVVGENGAGKSTLMRILCGEVRPNAGRVLVGGEPVGAGVHGARAAGIALVHQELSLVPDMSVAENIELGAPPTTAGVVRSRAQRRVAREALEMVGLSIDPDEPVGRLPLAARQFVEVAKALRRSPKVLILDEPTAALTPQETERLHDLLRELQGRGMAVIYISHRLDEVMSLCSTVTVLRDGRKVGEVKVADTRPSQLVTLMVGRDLTTDLRARRHTAPGSVVLVASNVRAPNVNGVSLEVREGEIVGIGGIVGAGRSEFVRAMIGLDPRHSGDAWIVRNGRRESITSYRQAIRHGIGFVPEDRRKEGLALEMTVSENVSLPSLDAISHAGFEQRGARAKLVDDVIRQLAIKTDSPHRDGGALSGGNQQKVAFGKWLPKRPSAIVLDEPTRGVDVGAKAEIHRLIRAIADDGAAVLVVSSDLPELLALSDRILVLSRGCPVGWLDGATASSEAVMSLATREQEAVVGNA
jgi:ABC-type sugar transport system ATPase subunit